jgi:hypothetical protein
VIIDLKAQLERLNQQLQDTMLVAETEKIELEALRVALQEAKEAVLVPTVMVEAMKEVEEFEPVVAVEEVLPVVVVEEKEEAKEVEEVMAVKDVEEVMAVKEVKPVEELRIVEAVTEDVVEPAIQPLVASVPINVTALGLLNALGIAVGGGYMYFQGRRFKVQASHDKQLWKCIF